MRWRLIKAFFTKAIAGESALSPWQDRYWEHTIRDEDDLQRHVGYINWNPVKYGHVPRVGDSPHSSVHRYLRDGVLPANWGDVGVPQLNGRCGE